MNHNQPAPLLLSLGIGLALGALGASWYLGFGSDPGGRGLSGGPGAAASQANQGASLQGEPPAPSTLDPAEPSGSPAPVRRAEQSGGRDLVTVRLAALERAYRAGDLAPEALTELTVSSLVDAGLPGEALDLMVSVGSRKSWQYASVGRALARAGDEQRALEAFGHGIRVDPGNSSVTFAMCKLDPVRCLAELREAIAEGGLEQDRDSQGNLITALEAAGLEAEALVILERRIDESPHDGNLLERLQRLDPVAYETHLLELLVGDTERWLDDLVEHLEAAGRGNEAIPRIEQRLEAEPGDLYWIGLLATVAPQQARAELDRSHPGSDPSEDVADAYFDIGEQLWERGSTPAAIDAWEQAVRRSPLDSFGELDYASELYDSAPARLARAMEVRRGPDSTAAFLGDLGNVYWVAGETERALASWRHAAQLDPEAAWWQEALERAAQGQDPLD